MKKLLKILLLGFVVLAILGSIAKNKKLKEGKELAGPEEKITPTENTGSTAGTKPVEVTLSKPLQKILISGDDPKSGYADASLEYSPDGTGWLAYSRAHFASAAKRYVETHIAKSSDKGATWQYVATANTSNDHVVNGKFAGVWRNETPSLVYDPSDEADKRWKLYYQRYLAVPLRPHAYTENIIAYKYAPSPAGPWSEEVCVLGAKSNCAQTPGDMHSSLKNMIFFNELGTLSLKGRLYMSADMSPSDTGVGTSRDLQNRKMVLLSSSSHGKNWQYAGVLTNYSDATNLGYVTFTASSLVQKNGQPYLLISPSGSIQGKNKAHDGSYLAKFTDIESAKLLRDGKGNISFLQIIKPALARGGQSDYDSQNTAGGIIFSQLNAGDSSQPFQIFNTFRGILE